MRTFLSILCLLLWVPFQAPILERAQTAMDQGNLTEALAHYHQALRQFPSLQGQIYFNLGQTHWATGQVDSAQRYFEQSLHLLPKAWASEARNNLGFIQVQEQKYALGLKQFQRALTLNPNNEQARVNFELASALLLAETPPPSNRSSSVRTPNSHRGKGVYKRQGEYGQNTFLSDSLSTLEMSMLFNQLRDREKSYVQQLTRRPRKFLLSNNKPNW